MGLADGDCPQSYSVTSWLFLLTILIRYKLDQWHGKGKERVTFVWNYSIRTLGDILEKKQYYGPKE